MDDDSERMMAGVRLDTRGFAQDVGTMRASLETLKTSMPPIGGAIEGELVRAVRIGKLSFEDLRKVALSVLADIAAAAIRAGVGSIIGGKASGGAGAGIAGALLGLIGAPGRATGGPVSPDRPYWVGERGPELFVPTASGHVAAAMPGGARDVRVAITVNAPAGETPAALQRSGRQVARAVRQALMEAG